MRLLIRTRLIRKLLIIKRISPYSRENKSARAGPRLTSSSRHGTIPICTLMMAPSARRCSSRLRSISTSRPKSANSLTRKPSKRVARAPRRAEARLVSKLRLERLRRRLKNPPGEAPRDRPTCHSRLCEAHEDYKSSLTCSNTTRVLDC